MEDAPGAAPKSLVSAFAGQRFHDLGEACFMYRERHEEFEREIED